MSAEKHLARSKPQGLAAGLPEGNTVRDLATWCNSELDSLLTPTGFEPVAASLESSSKLGKTPLSRAAESGAVSGNSKPIDADLARIIDAWPTLPEPIRRAMLAMIGVDP